MPYSISEIRQVKNRLDAKMGIQDASTQIILPTVFDGTITDVLRLEEEAFECELEVPYVFTYLLGQVEYLGGCNREGIFRKSPDLALVSKLKDKMQNFEYDLLGSNNPYVPAEILKRWLRSLREPVIPHTIYDQGLQIGAMYLQNEEKLSDQLFNHCLAVCENIPPPNYSILCSLAGFIDLASDPNHIPKTKMTRNAFCVVFSPNIMRTLNNSDPFAAIENVHNENAFVECLIEYIIAAGQSIPPEYAVDYQQQQQQQQPVYDPRYNEGVPVQEFMEEEAKEE